jgi:hypothetical protein
MASFGRQLVKQTQLKMQKILLLSNYTWKPYCVKSTHMYRSPRSMFIVMHSCKKSAEF